MNSEIVDKIVDPGYAHNMSSSNDNPLAEEVLLSPLPAPQLDSYRWQPYDALLYQAGGLGKFQKISMPIIIASLCAAGWAVYD